MSLKGLHFHHRQQWKTEQYMNGLQLHIISSVYPSTKEKTTFSRSVKFTLPIITASSRLSLPSIGSDSELYLI